MDLKYTQYAEQVFEWVAPYCGSSDGLGLMSTQQIKSIVESKFSEIVGHSLSDESVKIVLLYCNGWVKHSSRPFTLIERELFIKDVSELVWAG